MDSKLSAGPCVLHWPGCESCLGGRSSGGCRIRSVIASNCTELSCPGRVEARKEGRKAGGKVRKKAEGGGCWWVRCGTGRAALSRCDGLMQRDLPKNPV